MIARGSRQIGVFKQNTTESATKATVTKENWREYVRERLSNSKMRSCMQNGIDRLEVKDLSKNLSLGFSELNGIFQKNMDFIILCWTKR